LSLIERIGNFLVRFPALVAGIIIYAYFLLTTLDFYQKAKNSALNALESVKHFDTLLWMWLLAWVLIKILHYRTRLHEQEQLRLQYEQRLQVREAQLKSFSEIVRKLQHDLNNPLTILLAYLRRAERGARDHPEVLRSITEARESADRIFQTLSTFSNLRAYEAESYSNENTSRVDEAGAPRG
jgi:signal transduction histidine kinase